LRMTRLMKKSSCSDTGSTSGPSVVMLAFSAWPAMDIRSLDRYTPARAPVVMRGAVCSVAAGPRASIVAVADGKHAELQRTSHLDCLGGERERGIHPCMPRRRARAVLAPQQRAAAQAEELGGEGGWGKQPAHR